MLSRFFTSSCTSFRLLGILNKGMIIFLIRLVFDFFKFWFIEAPVGLMEYFASLNTAAMKFLSLRVLLVTFFKPWKNEYREGLVGFSIAMGMIVKSMFIFFDVLALLVMLVLETLVISLFLCWPIATVVYLIM